MFGSLGFTELILILFIVLIIFGAGKLPQLGEGVGKAIKGFKKSVHEAEVVESEAHNVAERQNPAPVSPPSSEPDPVASQAGPVPQSEQTGTGSLNTSSASKTGSDVKGTGRF